MVTRKLWLDTMLRTADPVLTALAGGRLHRRLPMTFHPDRAEFAHLEAFGRTLAGIAPWLRLRPDGEEGELRDKYLDLVRVCMDMATDPSSPDYMNFTTGYGQALVDAAFLAHGIMRAPEELYFGLDERVRRNIVAALRATRRFTPYRSNWLLFSAMIEALLKLVGEDHIIPPVEDALTSFTGWYVGDGLYSDGDMFHLDFYNSFVIHPMLLDILPVFSEDPRWSELLEKERARASRAAAILERLIAPDGSWPVVGRSVTYRCGAFQLLAQAALQGLLPDGVSPAQVRCALTAAIGRSLTADSYDSDGFLLPGVAGVQPSLAEGYISVGSLYLAETVFLPLGLPESHPFWSSPDTPWTQKRLWSSEDLPADRATD